MYNKFDVSTVSARGHVFFMPDNRIPRILFFFRILTVKKSTFIFPEKTNFQVFLDVSNFLVDNFIFPFLVCF